MALKVWLPLDGDLRNLGCSDVTVTNNGATVDNSGKIGKCYNTTNGPIVISNLPNPSSISISFWMKRTSNTNTRQFMFTAWNGVTCELTTDGTITWAVYRNNYPTITASAISTSSGWVHYCGTFSPIDGLKLYINGELKSSNSNTTAISWSTTSGQIGKFGSYASASMLMNDFRIYDHCLSAAEVHEIAQGLVLHYKLDDTYMETPTFLDCIINDTAYNSSISKYGYNTTSNLAKTQGLFYGKQCTKISTITEGQSAQPYCYFSNLFTSDGTNAPEYKALSFDYYTTCPTTTWLNIYKLGSGTGTATWKTISSAGTRTGTYTNSSSSILVTPNEWNHIEVIFHGTTTANAEWGYCVNGPTHTSNANYYFLFANIQLEQNDHVTGYGENLHNNIIQDSSGYGHNGTITGNISTSTNSSRYSHSIYLPSGNTDYITTNDVIGNFSTGITMNIWFKSNCNTPGNNYHEIFNIATAVQDFEFAIHKSGYFRGGMVINGTRYVDNTNNTNITDGTWHMITMTYDGTTLRRYVDGIDKKDTTISGTLTSTSCKFLLGHYGTNTSYYAKEAYLSDARIYVTPLLDTDIKLLYNVGMKIDNLGEVHSFEFDENQSNLMWRPENARAAGLGINYNEGLGSYTQSNCQVTCDSNGYRIYRPPNLTVADNGNTMWGGLKVRNSTDGGVHIYDATKDNIFGLIKGHTYVFIISVKGKSSNSTAMGITNNMGWGGGGLNPSPTNVVANSLGENFNGEKEIFYKFTINDDVVKTCTTSYSSFVQNNKYLSYMDFTFNYNYTNTGTLGTDLYISNISLYDITNTNIKLNKDGTLNVSALLENRNTAKIYQSGIIESTEFIEL